MKTKSIWKCLPWNAFAFLFLLSLVLLGAACVYPNGMTKAEFEALPKSQRMELLAQQRADYDKSRADERARQEKREAEAQTRVNEIRSNAKYGDIIIVRFQSGRIKYSKQHIPFVPFSIELAKGQKANPVFRSADGVHVRNVFVSFDEVGRSLDIDGYDFIENEGWRRGQGEWAQGKHYTAKRKEINDTGVEDLTLSIVFKPIY